MFRAALVALYLVAMPAPAFAPDWHWRLDGVTFPGKGGRLYLNGI